MGRSWTARASHWWPAVIVVVGALAAYHNSFTVPFLHDDRASILENPTIRSLWPPSIPLSPPSGHGLTVSGRPLVNLSLALNFAVSGTQVWSYHALNLATHTLGGLILFGLARRTLRSAPLTGRYGQSATATALAIALLWVLHPLQTGSVTYIVQRAESLMALFYLLTLYALARAAESPVPWRWQAVSIAACFSGMACKEVMVSAPLIVLVYDRTFFAGSWRTAWSLRRHYYLGLASAWFLLLALVASTGGDRGGTMGFGAGVHAASHWLSQFEAVWRYVRLAFWPHPLVFDYGRVTVADPLLLLPQIGLVLALVAGAVWALWRRPTIGMPGVWFFCILGPTSIVPGLAQSIAEHRAYLALAALIALVVTLTVAAMGRRALPAFFCLALCAGILTARRNADYQSEISIWTDTVEKRPGNPSARVNLGVALLESGRVEEAAAQFEEAIRLQPDSVAGHANMAAALLRAGRVEQSLEHGKTAVHLEPSNVNAHVNLGLALASMHQYEQAVGHFEEALRVQPDAADIHASLGDALAAMGRFDSAIVRYQTALRLEPDRAATCCGLARALVAQGDTGAARRACEQALRLQPGLPDALFILGNLDAAAGDFDSAIRRYRASLEVAPGFVAARNNLANALLMMGQFDEAIVHYRAILDQRPEDLSAQENLALAIQLRRSKADGR